MLTSQEQREAGNLVNIKRSSIVARNPMYGLIGGSINSNKRQKKTIE